MVFKPTLENPKLNPILKDIAAEKMIYAERAKKPPLNTIINNPTSVEKTKSIFIK
jgi:pyruvate,water dikinase